MLKKGIDSSFYLISVCSYKINLPDSCGNELCQWKRDKFHFFRLKTSSKVTRSLAHLLSLFNFNKALVFFSAFLFYPCHFGSFVLYFTFFPHSFFLPFKPSL